MSEIVVGTWYRKAQGRQHLPATDADIKRKDMKVHASFAEEMNLNAKNDPRATDTFVIDEKATHEYRERAMQHKKDLDAKAEMLRAEKTGGLSELVRMAAAGNNAQKEQPKKASKDERKELFAEAEELGLKVPKNIKTETLKERIANGREMSEEEEE